MKGKISLLTAVFLLLNLAAFGQYEEYNYQRDLSGITEQWHKVVLPNEVFSKVANNFSGIRIFGITSSKDTIEAPYLYRIAKRKTVRSEVDFKVINIASGAKGHYFTFEVPTEASVNQILLNFKQPNYDWKLTLEGSQNQQEWFTILKEYRILSIKNQLTDFQFNTLNFPPAKYRYFRVMVAGPKKPDLLEAKVALNEVTKGKHRKYSIQKSNIVVNKETKETEIELDLGLPVSVSHLKIGIKDTIDYYRPITIQFLADSFNTEKGWKYNYRTLARGTLNSLEENNFQFESTVLQRLKVVIENYDNQPLNIGTLEIKGYLHELVGRFTTPADYFLVYGNPMASPPKYDIAKFSDNIPQNVNELSLGEAKTIKQTEESTGSALFENKAWLWATLIVIIALLGGFTFNMMKKVN